MLRENTDIYFERDPLTGSRESIIRDDVSYDMQEQITDQAHQEYYYDPNTAGCLDTLTACDLHVIYEILRYC